jgi:hypothetical protein
MNDDQATFPSDKSSCRIVKKVFEEIEQFVHSKEKETPKDAVEKILKQYPKINEVKPDTKQYPRIQFNLSDSDVQEIIDAGYLDAEFRLTDKICQKNNKSTPLEKLLYSVLWKQGDLNKERHVVAGIKGGEISNEGIVFNYFGRHLKNKFEPIIDQHVIRAFRMKPIELGDNAVRSIRVKDFSTSRNEVEAKHKLIKDYLDWHKKLRDTYPEKDRHDFTYHLDLLLFGLGKYIKLTPRQSEKLGA